MLGLDVCLGAPKAASNASNCFQNIANCCWVVFCTFGLGWAEDSPTSNFDRLDSIGEEVGLIDLGFVAALRMVGLGVDGGGGRFMCSVCGHTWVVGIGWACRQEGSMVACSAVVSTGQRGLKAAEQVVHGDTDLSVDGSADTDGCLIGNVNPDSKPNENDVLSCAQGLIRVSSLRHFDQINGEVVADSFQQLSFGPVHEEVNSLSIFQPPLSRPPNCQMRKKLLVLDINGVLVDIVSPPPKERKADINIARHADFMKFCFERFEIGIWSSRNRKNISRMVDYLLGDMKHKLLFCWDLSHCAASKFKTLENKHKCLVFKQLRRLWEKQDPNLPWKEGEYNESNTLLLDDSPYKSLLNPPHSAVFPYSYTFLDEEKDTSLGEFHLRFA
ncbi:ubiquitin-like domain-containing CTD phosphatase 1 isoform X2 [Cucumis melo var. makuwa]|uniref:Mitochondrial import inner membrane translocase subunit TIM50 n=1 Tax=Cucumis melo var. makuwa TaxID=1194695 RepID=A0A5D3BX08_CUCMM|nr:ubiquitin-like domain-containing CTD phosphatase 1 isoform X2 [Cucumis melo var. makuwa]